MVRYRTRSGQVNSQSVTGQFKKALIAVEDLAELMHTQGYRVTGGLLSSVLCGKQARVTDTFPQSEGSGISRPAMFLVCPDPFVSLPCGTFLTFGSKLSPGLGWGFHTQ